MMPTPLRLTTLSVIMGVKVMMAAWIMPGQVDGLRRLGRRLGHRLGGRMPQA